MTFVHFFLSFLVPLTHEERGKQERKKKNKGRERKNLYDMVLFLTFGLFVCYVLVI